MAEYFVKIPLTGYVGFFIQAGSEKAAIAQAIEKARDIELTPPENLELEEGELIPHKQVVQGNVFLGALREAEAEEMED